MIIALGSSVSVMPYPLFECLDLPALRPTMMHIQLADQTICYPRGIAENVIVRIGKCSFKVDFVVIDMDESAQIPILLGRPFLETTDVTINVRTKILTLTTEEYEITFEMSSPASNNSSLARSLLNDLNYASVCTVITDPAPLDIALKMQAPTVAKLMQVKASVPKKGTKKKKEEKPEDNSRTFSFEFPDTKVDKEEWFGPFKITTIRYDGVLELVH